MKKTYEQELYDLKSLAISLIVVLIVSFVCFSFFTHIALRIWAANDFCSTLSSGGSFDWIWANDGPIVDRVIFATSHGKDRTMEYYLYLGDGKEPIYKESLDIHKYCETREK